MSDAVAMPQQLSRRTRGRVTPSYLVGLGASGSQCMLALCRLIGKSDIEKWRAVIGEWHNIAESQPRASCELEHHGVPREVLGIRTTVNIDHNRLPTPCRLRKATTVVTEMRAPTMITATIIAAALTVLSVCAAHPYA